MVDISLEVLKQIFLSGKQESHNSVLLFEGVLDVGFDTGSFQNLEKELGYNIPIDISEFLKVFGGTKLFVDEYGIGIEVFSIADIFIRNMELQKSTESYWPNHVIIGFDSAGDMLCLSHVDGKTHFGNLHHEAWECPELWNSEAIVFSNFANWLDMVIESKGETIPTNNISYKLEK